MTESCCKDTQAQQTENQVESVYTKYTKISDASEESIRQPTTLLRLHLLLVYKEKEIDLLNLV